MGVTLRKKKLPSGRVSLFLDIVVHGRRKKEALGFFLDGDRFHNRETMKAAEVIRARRELDVQASMYGLESLHKRKSSFLEYWQSVIDLKQKASTRDSFDNAFEYVKAFAGGDVVFGGLTRDWCEKFKSYLLKEEISQNTAQKYFSHLKTVLNHAVRDNIIGASPAAFITIKKQATLPVFLNIEEVRLLARTPCANQVVRDAFLFSCFTGLRSSDVISLTWDKVSDGYLEFTQKKTGESERLPLSVQAKKILEAQRDVEKNPRVNREHPENTVFGLPRQSTIDKELKKWGKDAGLKKRISMHKARHTFATLSLSSGNDIYTTSKLLGHRNLQTTQIYAQVIDEKKREAVNMLPLL